MAKSKADIKLEKKRAKLQSIASETIRKRMKKRHTYKVTGMFYNKILGKFLGNYEEELTAKEARELRKERDVLKVKRVI